MHRVQQQGQALPVYDAIQEAVISVTCNSEWAKSAW